MYLHIPTKLTTPKVLKVHVYCLIIIFTILQEHITIAAVVNVQVAEVAAVEKVRY